MFSQIKMDVWNKKILLRTSDDDVSRYVSNECIFRNNILYLIWKNAKNFYRHRYFSDYGRCEISYTLLRGEYALASIFRPNARIYLVFNDATFSKEKKICHQRIINRVSPWTWTRIVSFVIVYCSASHTSHTAFRADTTVARAHVPLRGRGEELIRYCSTSVLCVPPPNRHLLTRLHYLSSGHYFCVTRAKRWGKNNNRT